MTSSLPIERDGLGLAAVAVDDARHPVLAPYGAGAAGAGARARGALISLTCGAMGLGLLMGKRARPLAAGRPRIGRGYSGDASPVQWARRRGRSGRRQRDPVVERDITRRRPPSRPHARLDARRQGGR